MGFSQIRIIRMKYLQVFLISGLDYAEDLEYQRIQ